MKIELTYTEDTLRAYKKWIQDTGICIAWDYYYSKNKNYVVYDFVHDMDLVAFKLAFKIR